MGAGRRVGDKRDYFWGCAGAGGATWTAALCRVQDRTRDGQQPRRRSPLSLGVLLLDLHPNCPQPCSAVNNKVPVRGFKGAHNANQNWLIALIGGFYRFLFGHPAGVLRGSGGQGDDSSQDASKDSLGNLQALLISQKMPAQGHGRVNSPVSCSTHISDLLKHELRLGPGLNLLLFSSGPH